MQKKCLDYRFKMQSSPFPPTSMPLSAEQPQRPARLPVSTSQHHQRPTTAAISYGIERLGGNRRVLVFDLGGGTFDVTLMEIKGISFRTIASDGNAEPRW